MLGDFIQTSIKDFSLQCHINLVDGHYSINKKEGWKVHGISPKEAPILVFSGFNKNDQSVLVYDGVKEYDLPMETYNKYWYKPIEAEFRLVKLPMKNLSLKTYYDSFIKSAHELKEKSFGRINLWKTGGYRTTALHLLQTLTPTIQPEYILQDEAIWIQKASTGALIWSKKYEGPVDIYDFVSEYPSIMKNNNFSVPISRGRFENMTSKAFNELKFFSYGLYRCVITGVNPHLFRPNTHNYYCHYDLTSARELGYDIQLIEDDQPNCLFYADASKLNGSVVFSGYVDILFDLKQKKVAGAKDILNILWGALVQQKPITLRQIPGTICDISDNKDILRIDENSDSSYSVKIISRNAVFQTSFARMKPFLLAKGRQNLMRVIKPNYENIYRAHTDGIYCSKEITHKLGYKIGDLKHEKHITQCSINKMKVIVLKK